MFLRRFTKADLRSERAALVRAERRDWAEESRARCWNWKGVFVVVDGGGANALKMFWCSVAGVADACVCVSIVEVPSRNGLCRCVCSLLLLFSCIEFSSPTSKPKDLAEV